MLSYVARLGDPVAISALKPRMHHMFGLQLCMPAWDSGTSFLFYCKLGIWLYVIEKPLSTLVAVITYARGYYGGDSLFDLHTAYPYIVIVTSAVQMWALYVLVSAGEDGGGGRRFTSS